MYAYLVMCFVVITAAGLSVVVNFSQVLSTVAQLLMGPAGYGLN